MTSIQKVKVYDSRIIQNVPSFAVQEGAISLSNVPFQAITSSSSNLSFNINTPSKNVFMDRKLALSTGVIMAIDVHLLNKPTAAGGEDAIPVPILRFGDNCALCAFPLQSCMNSLNVMINNTNVTVNQKDILNELLRLTNMKSNRKLRTTPTMLDKYAFYGDANNNINSPLMGYGKSFDADSVSNGAFSSIEWCDINGNAQPEPTYPTDAASYGANKVKTFYFKFSVTENLVLSPFIFNEEESDSVGLYGVSNLSINATFGDVSRTLRIYNDSGTTAGNYNATFNNCRFASQNPFVTPTINCVFRTPPLSHSLPQVNILPYMETPRYISPQKGRTLQPNDTAELISDNIVMNQIPDLLLIYVKPGLVQDPTYGDFYLPPKNIAISYGTQAGIMSTMTQAQLFEISVNNGLDMDYNQFRGSAHMENQAHKVPLTGGFLVLKPGQDFALATGEAPGLLGNCNIQYKITVQNTSGKVITDPTIYTMAINSGFFENENGVSKSYTGVLSESDIISAPVVGETKDLQRIIGGSFWSKIGSTIKKIAQNPVAKAVGKAVSTEAKKMARASGNKYAKLAADGADYLGYGKSTGGAAKYAQLHNL